jgi:hypothetical protein
MVMVLAAMAAWTAAGQVFPPPPTGGAQGGAGGEAMPPAPGPLYGAVRAAGTVRRGDAVVWGDAQGRTITGADMGNSAWASTGMVAAAVSAAAAGMASTQQVAAAVAPLATTQQVAAAAAALTIHTNRADNPHGVTAAQVGAITAEVDPVAGPRLDLIEPETNKWNAAYGWGDHALAGYLLPADLAPYATTQQVAEAAAAIPRDRITTIDGSQWIDATGGVWRVSYGGGGYWTISILGTLYGSATNAYYEVRSAPFDFWNYDQAFWDGEAYFRWYPDGDPGHGHVYVEVQGVEDTHDYNYPTNDLADGVFEFYTSATYTHFVLAWSNDLASATTQHVDGVAWQSDLAPYATTQQVAEAVSGAVTNLNLYAVPVAGGKHELWMKE